MTRKNIKIAGMHCKSCEILIEDELSKIKGVHKTSVSHKAGEAVISYKGKVTTREIEEAIKRAGYNVCQDSCSEEKPWFSKDLGDYIDIATYLLILAVFIFILKSSNLELSVGNNFSSLPIVFLIGLTAGISTCMALVGGLVLGLSTKFSKVHPYVSTLEKFTPHLYFNLGRIVTFTVLGGLLGLVGSIFALSTSLTG